MFHYAIPYFLKGRIAINKVGTFNHHFITPNSVAFNWGLLLGLPGTLSLIPLGVIWLTFLWLILSKCATLNLIKEKVKLRFVTVTAILLLISILYPLVYYSYLLSYSIDPLHYGLVGYYYKGNEWKGNPDFIRHDGEINYDWGSSRLPLNPPFSIEWKGVIRIPRDGTYTFLTESDDGSWLYIDEELIVDNGGFHAPKFEKGSCELTKGNHDILLKYNNVKSFAMVKLYWQRGEEREIIPRSYFRTKTQ